MSSDEIERYTTAAWRILLGESDLLRERLENEIAALSAEIDSLQAENKRFREDAEQSTEFVLATINRELRAEVGRLRNPWVRVQTLIPGEGCVEVDNPQYPEPGQVVLIEIETVLGTKYEIGGLHKDAGTRQGYWSWPSFGVRWMPIHTQEQSE